MSDEKLKWKKEVSAGGVVYKKENDVVFVLLIFPKPWRNNDPQWTFPKGHIEKNEKPETAALREVKEETGIEAKIIQDLGSVKYNFVWNEETMDKSVKWYLMEYVSGDPANHDQEVEQAVWYELSQAEKLLTYDTDKEIFNKAKLALSLDPSPDGERAG